MTVCCTPKSLLLPLALLLGALALGLGASSFAAAKQDPKPPPEKPDGPGGEKPREGGRGWGRGQGGGPGLEGSMQSMKAAVKALEKELPAKDANAYRSISQFERGVTGAKLEEPPSIKELAEGERAAAVATYRRMMAELLVQATRVEHDILAAKWDDAGKSLEALKALQKPGHDKFKKDD
jgi:Cytochrome b562